MKALRIFAILLAIGLAFVGGYGSALYRRSRQTSAPGGDRRIL